MTKQQPWDGHCEDVLFATVSQPINHTLRRFAWLVVVVMIAAATLGAFWP